MNAMQCNITAQHIIEHDAVQYICATKCSVGNTIQ